MSQRPSLQPSLHHKHEHQSAYYPGAFWRITEEVQEDLALQTTLPRLHACLKSGLDVLSV